MGLGALLAISSVGLALAAWLTWRHAAFRVARGQALVLAAMALVGGGLALNPASLAGLHVRVVMAQGDVARLTNMPGMVEQLGPRSRVDLLEVRDDGSLRVSTHCLAAPDLLAGVQLISAADPSLVDAMTSRECNLMGLRTSVLAVLPSSRLSAAVGRALPGNAAETLRARLIEREQPLTLLTDDVGDRTARRWLITRPYAPGTDAFGHVDRVLAYAYALVPTNTAPTATTDVTIEHAIRGRFRTREGVPVRPWDARSQVIGPVPLYLGLDGSGYLDGVHWFRDATLPDQPWFAVVADSMQVLLEPPAASWPDTGDRWRPLREDRQRPDQPRLLDESEVWYRSDVFRRAANEVEADAVLTADPGRSPSTPFVAQGGRQVNISLPCPMRERFGVSLVSLDHGRASLGGVSILQHALVRELGTAARARTVDGRVYQAQVGSNPGGLVWQLGSCGQDGVFDARQRNLPAMVVRDKNDWAQIVRFTPALVDGVCRSYVAPSGSPLAFGDAPASAIARDLLPSSVLVRATVLAMTEPDLRGATRLDGVTVVLVGADIPVWPANHALPANPALMLLDAPAKPLNPERGWSNTAALQGLVGRGARVVVVPISTASELASSMAGETSGRSELAGSRLSQLCVGTLKSLSAAQVHCLAPVASEADATQRARELLDLIGKSSPPRQVGGESVRDQRLASNVTIYDDVCSAGPLLEASSSGRGTAVTMHVDPFSPINWLADGDGPGHAKVAMIPARGSTTGLGPQILSDVWFERARPFGNRASLGALSVLPREDGELDVVRPTTLAVAIRAGGATSSLGQLPIAGTGLVKGSVSRAALLPGAVLALSTAGGVPIEDLPIMPAPPSAVAVEGGVSWPKLARQTRGYVMSGGTLEDYHRGEWLPWVLLCAGALLELLFLLPLANPWAVLTWLPTWWRRPLTGDSVHTPLTLNERAQLDEAGRAAGRIVARKTAGEPEGVRAFTSGDSPNAILALDLASFTAEWKAKRYPQLIARVKTRRSQQVPRVTVLLDSSVLARGLEHEFLRARYWLLATAISQLSLAAGSQVRITSIDDTDVDLDIGGALDASAILRSIDALADATGTVRRPDELGASALCVLITPVSAERRDEYGDLLADLRSQGVHCILVHVSMSRLQFPGAYLNTRPSSWGVVNRQGHGARSASQAHDGWLERYYEAIGVPYVLFKDRREGIGDLTDALAAELRTPI